MPIFDIRTGYEKDYVDQFYGKAARSDDESRLNPMNDIQLVGKPDVFKLLYKSDFQTQV